MQSFYRDCRCCLIWFRELSNHSLTPENIKALFRVIRHYAGFDPIPNSDFVAIDHKEVSKTMNTMMSNSWWSRIWTVQEVVLPPTAMLVWSNRTLDWKNMIGSSWTLQGSKPNNRATGPHPITKIPQLRIGTRFRNTDFGGAMNALMNTRNRVDDFWNTLIRFQIRQATIPSDRVFGLIGLMRNQDLPKTKAILSDYDVKPELLCFYLASDAIKATNSFKPFFGLNPGSYPNGNMPSWATDWVSPDSKKNLRICNGFWDHVRRNSGKWYRASADTKLWIETNGSDLTISLRGFGVNTVTHIFELSDLGPSTWQDELSTATGKIRQQLIGILDL